jgi:hypothetical protein
VGSPFPVSEPGVPVPVPVLQHRQPHRVPHTPTRRAPNNVAILPSSHHSVKTHHSVKSVKVRCVSVQSPIPIHQSKVIQVAAN